MFQAGQNITLIAILQFWIPILRFIVCAVNAVFRKFNLTYWQPTERERKIDVAQKTMRRIGLGLLRESKAAVAAGDIEDKSNQRRDLLSLLVRANTSPDIPEHLRLSDEDVLARSSL